MTDTIDYKRPRGRAPKGKEWDRKKGDWIVVKIVEDKKTTKSTKKIAKTNYYLINIEDPDLFRPIDLRSKDKETIDIIKEYLIIQNKMMKLSKQFNKGMDFNEYVKEYSAIDGKHSELAIKLHEKDVFRSKHDIRTNWKLKKM